MTYTIIKYVTGVLFVGLIFWLLTAITVPAQMSLYLDVFFERIYMFNGYIPIGTILKVLNFIILIEFTFFILHVLSWVWSLLSGAGSQGINPE